MTHALTESNVTVHQLPKALLKKPVENRFELALQHWLDLYPASTSLRFGQDHASNDYYLAENMYGPRLKVMTRDEEFKAHESPKNSNKTSPEDIAKTMGIDLKGWMASDPSVEQFYSPQPYLQYEFRKELVEALNYGLAKVGCRTHRVRLSDHTPEYVALYNQYWSDENTYNPGSQRRIDLHEKMTALRDYDATLVWDTIDAFAAQTPAQDAIEAVHKYFAKYPNHPVLTHVTLDKTIEVKTLDDSRWIPVDQTTAERAFMDARTELSNPDHAWVKERGLDSDGKPNPEQLYAYMASKEPVPLVRNGQLLYQGLRYDSATAKNVGYVVLGRESCGTTGIEQDIASLMESASKGQLSQTQMVHSHLPDLLVSMAYHSQVVAHQRERTRWAQKNPIAYPTGQGDVMPKPLSALEVGDFVGASVDQLSSVDLWCQVTKREGDVLTLFVHNGHWDFKLNTATNQSLDHDRMKNFAGQAMVVYTAPIPITDGALYNEALGYMHEHVASLVHASPPDTFGIR